MTYLFQHLIYNWCFCSEKKVWRAQLKNYEKQYSFCERENQTSNTVQKKMNHCHIYTVRCSMLDFLTTKWNKSQSTNAIGHWNSRVILESSTAFAVKNQIDHHIFLPSNYISCFQILQIVHSANFSTIDNRSACPYSIYVSKLICGTHTVPACAQKDLANRA